MKKINKTEKVTSIKRQIGSGINDTRNIAGCADCQIATVVV
jgi:hypothetical protein